eukprot:GHVU01147716.1.p1 GENE.GHVU01147716.1~~GHVU01147716.1.p1  ORF type:complete len:121 (+),score=16.80 GHVU01147716.1:530-892(+)
MMMMVMMQSAVYTALIVCTHLRLCTIHLSVGLRDRIDDQQRGKQALPKRERERERDREREGERERDESTNPLKQVVGRSVVGKWYDSESRVASQSVSHSEGGQSGNSPEGPCFISALSLG